MAVQSHCLAFARIVRVLFDQVVEYVKDMPVGYASRRLRQGHTVGCALRDRAHGPCLLLQPCLWAVFALCRACVPSLVGRRPGIWPTRALPMCRACLAVDLGLSQSPWFYTRAVFPFFMDFIIVSLRRGAVANPA